MKRFVEIVNGNNIRQTLYFRCLKGFWLHLWLCYTIKRMVHFEFARAKNNLCHPSGNTLIFNKKKNKSSKNYSLSLGPKSNEFFLQQSFLDTQDAIVALTSEHQSS